MTDSPTLGRPPDKAMAPAEAEAITKHLVGATPSVPHPSELDSGKQEPNSAQRLAFAQALLAPDVKLYRPDGSNVAEDGTVTIAEAIASGRPFFGNTLPHIWAIDVDHPEHPSYEALLALLDANGLDFIVCDSGSRERSGRHVFVCVPTGSAYRQTISAEIDRLHGKAVTWRLQRGGSPIRSPLGWHRNGVTWSEPEIDSGEALALVQSWYREATGTEPGSPVKALPLWAEALRRGDYADCDRLRPLRPLARKGNGHVDRSAADLALAHAYRNAGHTIDDYLADRLPGGRFPSPKAGERSQPERYLQQQWAAACERPAAAERFRAGLDRLDDFEQAVAMHPGMSRTVQKIIGALIATAEKLGKTTVGLSWTDMQEATGCARSTVSRALRQPAMRLFVEMIRNREPGHVATYRLRVLETLAGWCKRATPHICTEGDRLERYRNCTIPEPNHPLFWERPEALRGTGYRTLVTFDTAEPRTKAEAMRQRSGVSERTWKTKAAELQRAGIIVPTEPAGARFVIAPGINWDALAMGRGLLHAQTEHVERLNAQRHDRIEALYVRGWISDEEAAQRHESVDKRAISPAEVIDFETGEILSSASLHQESLQRERTGTLEAPEGLSVPERPSAAVYGAVVDFERFEGHKAPGQEVAEIVKSHSSQTPYKADSPVADATANPFRCACCGHQTDRLEPVTGLPWHGHCLMPRWLVSYYDPLGFTVPAHLIANPQPVVDRCGDAWTDYPAADDGCTVHPFTLQRESDLLCAA
jgi:hypothetical protein